MKSSPNLNPKGFTPQAWMPTEFHPNNVESSDQIGEKQNGIPVELFDKVADPANGSGALPRVIKAIQNVSLTSWQPGNITSIPKKEIVSNAGWEAIIKYETPQSPHDAAQEVINRARLEADQIIQNAQQAVKEVQEHAYQDGWNSAMGEINDRMVAAARIVQELSEWRDNLMAQSEPMIINIILSIAQKMFGAGYELDRETLQATFNRVLENARSLGNLRIYVNPDDASNLGPYWREFQESITSHTVEIIPSSSIARGGCYVNGQWGSADGRIETQLKSIMDTFDSETSVSQN